MLNKWEVMTRGVSEVLGSPVTLGHWVTELLLTEELPWAMLCHHGMIVIDRLFEVCLAQSVQESREPSPRLPGILNPPRIPWEEWAGEMDKSPHFLNQGGYFQLRSAAPHLGQGTITMHQPRGLPQDQHGKQRETKVGTWGRSEIEIRSW